MTGFNWADVPAILVEVGFTTNSTEDRALATDAYLRGLRIGSAAVCWNTSAGCPARC